MTSSLEIKKVKVELLRVTAARGEMELRIEESMEMIKKLEESIKIQLAKEQELSMKIKELEGNKG